jgi:hypothetical protein
LGKKLDQTYRMLVSEPESAQQNLSKLPNKQGRQEQRNAK